MHRSTQEIFRRYFQNSLNVTQIAKEIYWKKLRTYLEGLQNSESLRLMEIMTNHLQQLLVNTNLIEDIKHELKIILGIYLYHTYNLNLVSYYIEDGVKHITDPYNIFKARALTYLSINYRKQGKIDKALKYANQSLDLYENIIDDFGYTKALYYAGLIYAQSDDYINAKNLLEKSINVASQNPLLKFQLSSAQVFLARILRDLGEYDKAITLVNESRQFRLNENYDLLHICWVEGHLGSIYKEQGNYEEVKLLLKKILKAHESTQYINSQPLEWILPDISSAYRNIGNYTEAAQALKSGLKIAQKAAKYGFTLNLGRNLVHMGKLYHKLGQYDKAQQYFMEGKTHQVKTFGKDSLKTSWVNSELAKLYADLGQLSKAQSLAKKSLTIHKVKRKRLGNARICY